MPRFMSSRLEMMLFDLERSLREAPDAKRVPLGRHRDLLRQVLIEMLHSPWLERSSDPSDRHNLMVLGRRLERAGSRPEFLDIARELRLHALALSAASRTSEMEARLHALEEEIHKASEPGAGPPETPEPEKEVTLESLKGKDILFVIMPYGEDYQDVWLGGIKRAATGTGFMPVRIDMITKSADITDDIVAAIKQSKVVVADVTKNNPNVMFELGYALALGKPHAIISQSTEYLPFDIQNVRTIIYRNTWRGVEELHTSLQKFIKGAHKEPPKKAPKK